MAKTPSKKAPSKGAKKAAAGKKRNKKRVESSAAHKTKHVTLDFHLSLFFGLPVGFQTPVTQRGNYPGGYTGKAVFRHDNKTWTFYVDKKIVD